MKCPNCGSEMRNTGPHADGTRVYVCPMDDCGARLKMPPVVQPKIIHTTPESSELLQRIERVELSLRVLSGDSADRVREIHELRKQVAALVGRMEQG